ncbi:MAG TPA: cytochrome c biogenesis protein CcdA [Ignavibacteriales bacterium]|nr:cytochrome c biogenesis protein CcdA [Ignavibacteriales bacterium]
MLDDVFSFLSSSLETSGWIALLASFGWGVLSIVLSPCHLAGIPLVIGFLNGYDVSSVKRSFYLSFIFSAGILITIAAIGIITLSIGNLMGDIGSTGNYIVAAVLIVMGLYLADVIKFSWGGNILRPLNMKPWAAALIIGLLFGAALGPCAFAFLAPVLGFVFQVSAESPMYGGSLIAAFALGHCAVITGAGTFSSSIQSYLNWTEKTKAVSIIKRVCGALVVAGGIYLIVNTY